jgi:tetratricopeptide (TPR) repeat protein
MAADPRIRLAESLLARAEAARVAAPRRALVLVRRSRRALGRRPALPDTRALSARIDRSLGHALRGMGRHAEAEAAYRRAARGFRTVGESVEAARCDIGRVDALMYLGRYAAARAAGSAALRVLRRAGEGAAVGRLLNNLGNLEYRLDRPQAALALYARARRALARDGLARARVDANRSNCLALRGRPVEARRLVRAARADFARAGRALDVAGCDYAAAYLLFLEHRYAEALFALAALEPPFERAGADDYRALLDLDAAEIYLRLGRSVDAVTAASRAAERCRALGLRAEWAKACTFEALGRAARGDLVPARTLLGRAGRVFRAEGNVVWAAIALLAEAELALVAGRRRRAHALAIRAADAFARAGELEREGGARLVMARAGLVRGRSFDAPARRALARARRCARAAGSPFLAFRVACLEGDVALARGDRAGARRAYRRAQRRSESTAARVRSEMFRSTDWSAWEEAYPRLVALEVEAGRADAVFREIERARRRAFEAAGRERRGRPAGIDPALERRLRALSCRFESRGRGRAPLGPAPGFHAVAAQDEMRAVARELDRLDRVRAARRDPSSREPSLRLTDHQARLAPGVLALEWFETARGTGVLALDRGGARLFADVAPPGELAVWAEEIRYHARGAAAGDAAAGAAMSELLTAVRESLLGPPLAWARARGGGVEPAELVIVPVAPLASFPWSALSRIPVSVVPSLGFAPGPEPFPATGRVLLVGLGGDDLPGVRREIATLARLVPRARVLLGPEATVARVSAALAEGVDWLHVAGHGRHDEDRPILSGLRLADRWAHLTDLAPRGRSPRVVVLAACRTGEIAGGFRNDWQGLPGGLLRSGTRALLASLWDLEDAAAHAMSIAIHGDLLAGKTLGQAVRNAQLARPGVAAARWNAWSWGLFGRSGVYYPGVRSAHAIGRPAPPAETRSSGQELDPSREPAPS